MAFALSKIRGLELARGCPADAVDGELRGLVCALCEDGASWGFLGLPGQTRVPGGRSALRLEHVLRLRDGEGGEGGGARATRQVASLLEQWTVDDVDGGGRQQATAGCILRSGTCILRMAATRCCIPD
jgi:hypothetical protein